MTEKAQIGASLADSGFSTYLNIVDVQKIYWYHDLFSGRKKWNAGWRSTVILSVFGVIGDIAVDMISLLVAVGMAAVSYLCSCRIMKKKEL